MSCSSNWPRTMPSTSSSTMHPRRGNPADCQPVAKSQRHPSLTCPSQRHVGSRRTSHSRNGPTLSADTIMHIPIIATTSNDKRTSALPTMATDDAGTPALSSTADVVVATLRAPHRPLQTIPTGHGAHATPRRARRSGIQRGDAEKTARQHVCASLGDHRTRPTAGPLASSDGTEDQARARWRC